VVLKIKAATASVTTRSHATLRETVFVIIRVLWVGWREEEAKILMLLSAERQTFCDVYLIFHSAKK